ncbi:MAG: thioredoxin family protein [bacterium]|nr:thioredoxin family protein [bacterium]
MGNYSDAPRTSNLLDDELRLQIKGVFEKLTEDLEIVAVVDPAEEKSKELISLLFDVETLGEHIRVSIYDKGENPSTEADFDPEGRTPAMGFYKNGEYIGVAFFGVPGGKEMNSFILGCYNAAGPGQEVDKWSQKKIGKLKKNSEIKVFVSLACHHCAATVIGAQHLAAMSPKLTATMIDANLYPDLVEKYKIERVPMVVINDEKTLMGEKSISDLAAVLE